MSCMNTYHVLAFYQITQLKDPRALIKEHKEFFKDRDITSRIYISEQGINGQMSASIDDSEEYIAWIRSKSEFKEMPFKIHEWPEQAFPRKTIKYRKNLVSCDQTVDFSKRGEHVSPEKWKEMIDSDRDYMMIDVRNDYEWKIGHFKNADLPECKNFRELEEYADQLEKNTGDQKPPVMMYCTGGIRCELYSSILKEKGFDEVYQLDGGVINYGQKVGSDHWLGKLFVFDDRLSVPISKEEAPPIGECHFCKTHSDNYYNCANMECNTLFLCCPECVKEHQGCCQESCSNAERVRPYHQQNPHKPFRRKHYYES